MKFLKSNSNSYFSAEELSRLLNKNVQSIYASMRKLKCDLDVKEVKSKNKTKHYTKLYAFLVKDEFFELALESFLSLKCDKRLDFCNANDKLLLLVLAELKKKNMIKVR